MKRVVTGLLAAAAVALGAYGAQAAQTTTSNGTLVVVQGNPQANETDIFQTGAANSTSSDGHIGSQNGPGLINFTTTTAVDFANGFATIDLCNSCNPQNLINSVTITSPNGIQWNDMQFGVLPTSAHQTDLTITAFLGATQLGQVVIDNIGSGLDPILTFISVSGLMDKLVLTSNFGAAQFKQFEISLNAIPLPPAALLFGTALVGMGFLRSRRRKDKAAQA